MKKFLFTLASLFVAGTAFANSYLYIDKVEVTADMVGEELEIPVKAHYEEYVSAWEMWVEAPEGLEVTGCEAGEGMTISYYNSRGKASTLTAPIYGADGHFITAVADAGYTPEKVTYGCVKWAPGEYEEMLLLYVEVTDAYVGGDISIRFEPACGQDTRFGDDMRAKVAWGNTVPWIDETMVAAEPELAVDDAENPTKVIATDGAVLYRLDETSTVPVWVKVENPFNLPEPAATEQTIQFMACMPNGDGLVGSDFVPLTVVIPAATTPAQPAPEPTITYENGVVSAAVAGEDPAEHEVELYIVNGEERTKVENPYTPTQTFDEQNITFVAVTIANDDESENTECDPVTVTVPAKDDNQAPKPTFRVEDGKLYAESAEGLQVVLTVNGETVPNPYTLPTENTSYTDAIVIEFVAVAIADGEVYNVNSEVATYHFELAPLQKTDVESPSVQGMSNDDAWLYNVIILGEGDGELKYTVVDGEGNTVVPAQTIVDDETGLVTLVFEKGNEAANIIVTAWTEEGPTCNASDEEVEPITIPALDKVATPEISYTVNDDNTITITATCATEGATIVLKDPEGNVVENPTTVSYDPYQGYNATWTATATKAHMQDSDEGSKTITLTAGDKTPVEAPSIMGMKAEGSKTLYNIVITPDPATDGELDYTATPMGALLRAGAVTIQYERGEEPYDVEVTAKTLEGATCQESPVEQKTITVPALDKTATPSVTYSYENGELNVWAYGSDDDAVYTLYCDGEPYTGEMPITFDIYDGYGPHTWTATAKAPDMLVSDESAPAVIEIPAETKYYNTPAPVISEPVVNDENVTFTVTGEGTVTVTVTTSEGPKTYTGQGSVEVVLPRGEEYDMAIVNATAEANEVPEGYDAVAPGRVGPEYIDIPAIIRTEAPTINQTEGISEYVYLVDENGDIIYAPDGKPAAAVDEDGNRIIAVDGHWIAVTFTNNDEDANAVIEYSLDGENWETWDGAAENFNQNGTYTVYARAKADGKAYSEVVTATIIVTKATGVNELANGKTVAGVRYFNMAGQEMNEANGVTIVVTTYTDGTTSAVKVIK